jgi:general secretion pathway protein A
MDLAFWVFRRWPFDRKGHAKQPLPGAVHEEALARLLFLVEERRRCGMVTGAAGTGKSCLLREICRLAERLGRLCVQVDATGLEGHELAARIAEGAFAGCDESGSALQTWSCLQRRFEGLAIARQPLVVCVDHFDLVEFACSQTLRRLMHLADTTGAELTLLIAVRERYTAPLLLDSVELSVELTPWSANETSRFVSETLRSAGAKQTIFSEDALEAIHSLTHGVPADVVWLCDLALLAAMSEDRRRIDVDVIESAAAELAPRDWLLARPDAGRQSASRF